MHDWTVITRHGWSYKKTNYKMIKAYKKAVQKEPTNKMCLLILDLNPFRSYNLGQKVGDKFTKLNKIGFSMECFTADFLQFFTEKRQNLAFGWTAGYSPSNPSISRIFLKFPNFLRS